MTLTPLTLPVLRKLDVFIAADFIDPDPLIA